MPGSSQAQKPLTSDLCSNLQPPTSNLLPAVKPLLLTVIVTAVAAQAQSPRTFQGTITDSECAKADHSQMHMGDTDAECVKACMDYHDARLALFDGTAALEIVNQAVAVKFAGRKVTVTGSLDEKTRRLTITEIAYR